MYSIQRTAALSRLVEMYERTYVDCNDSSPHQKEGCYKYIPLSNRLFLEQLEIVRELFPGYCSFIDVGCGIGSKVALADILGFNAFGIELNKRYCLYASRLLCGRQGSRTNEHIINKNAFDHKYDKYDVIYFYCPFQDSKQEIKLENYLYQSAKSGAIIIANSYKAHSLWEDSTKVKLTGKSRWIFVKL